MDVAVAVRAPAIAPRRDEIIARLADASRRSLPSRVSIKGTTSDGLGFTAADGLAAWAVATVEPLA